MSHKFAKNRIYDSNNNEIKRKGKPIPDLYKICHKLTSLRHKMENLKIEEEDHVAEMTYSIVRVVRNYTNKDSDEFNLFLKEIESLGYPITRHPDQQITTTRKNKTFLQYQLRAGGKITKTN